jgi:hypothetical protein
MFQVQPSGVRTRNGLRNWFRPLVRSGRLFARLFAPAQAPAESAQGRLPSPTRPPERPRAIFRRYLNDALSGGGRR